MNPRSVVLPLVLALAAPAASAVHARVLSDLACSQAIGTGALRFAKRIHLAQLHCVDAEASGRSCDHVERDATIAGTTQKLSVRLAGKCGVPLDLGGLGFPGLCPDDGLPFTDRDLFACIRDSHAQRVAAALGIEYPPRPDTLDEDESTCQRQIGAGGARFIKQTLKFRQRCLNGQRRGAIAPGADCRAGFPPAGPGTGDLKTDEGLSGALDKLQAQLANGCEGIVLESLGFPGSCPDPDGPPFTLADLQRCMQETHTVTVDEMLGFEYPAP